MSFVEGSINEFKPYPQYSNMGYPEQDDTVFNKTATNSESIYHFIDQTNIGTKPRKIKRESAHLEKHRKVERLKNEAVKEKQRSVSQKHRENQVKKTQELESEVNRLTKEIRISEAAINDLRVENGDLNEHLMFLRKFLLENLSPQNLVTQTEESETKTLTS